MKMQRHAIVIQLGATFLGVAVALLLPSCKKSETPPQASESAFSVTEEELSAKFYYDLGPKSIDVAAYPPQIQEGYKLFNAACGECHTTARALNAPMVSAQDWKRFVHRMHVKTWEWGRSHNKKDEEKVVEFLTYDSKIRKTEPAKEFQAEQEKLKARYEIVVKERDRKIFEETRNLPKKETPYVGVK